MELGEIEVRSLNTASLVRQAVVVAREDTPGEKRLRDMSFLRQSTNWIKRVRFMTKTTFSLFFFGADSRQEKQYELYLKSAKFADLNQFEAIWTPSDTFIMLESYTRTLTLSAALSTVTANVSSGGQRSAALAGSHSGGRGVGNCR